MKIQKYVKILLLQIYNHKLLITKERVFKLWLPLKNRLNRN